MNHKYIFHSEWSQTQMTIYYVIPFIWRSESGKTLRMDDRPVVVRLDYKQVDYKRVIKGIFGGGIVLFHTVTWHICHNP